MVKKYFLIFLVALLFSVPKVVATILYSFIMASTKNIPIMN